MRHIRIGLVLAALGGCEKTQDVPEVRIIRAETAAATVDASAADAEALAAATREKLMALAVASECLRKGNTPPEQSANTMLALYKAHEVDLETYTREMSKLAGDPAFQAAIDAKTKDCAIVPVATSDTLAASDTVVPADTVVADTGPEVVPAAADTVAVVDTQVVQDTLVVPETIVDTSVSPETIADTRIVDTTPDTRVLLEVSIEPDKPEVAFTGTWTGQLYGGASPGNLRLVINGRTITSAVATFGKSSIRLKGTISEKGALSIGGTSGQDFIRISGTVQTGGRGINGTWDGVVEMKKGSGRFLLKR